MTAEIELEVMDGGEETRTVDVIVEPSAGSGGSAVGSMDVLGEISIGGVNVPLAPLESLSPLVSSGDDMVSDFSIFSDFSVFSVFSVAAVVVMLEGAGVGTVETLGVGVAPVVDEAAATVEAVVAILLLEFCNRVAAGVGGTGGRALLTEVGWSIMRSLVCLLRNSFSFSRALRTLAIFRTTGS